MNPRAWLVVLCSVSSALAAPAKPPGQEVMEAWIKKNTSAYPAADYRAADAAKQKAAPSVRLELTPEGFVRRAKAQLSLSDNACELAAILMASGAGVEMLKQGSTRPLEVVLSCTSVDTTARFLPKGADQKSGPFLEVHSLQRSRSYRYAVGSGPFEFSVPASEVKPAPPGAEASEVIRWRYEVAAAGLGLKASPAEAATSATSQAPCWPAFWGGVDRHCAALASAKGADACGAAALLQAVGAEQRELDQGFEKTLTRVVRVTCADGWAAEVSLAKPGQVMLSVFDPGKDEVLSPKMAPLPATAPLSSEAPAAGVHAKQLAERMAPRPTESDVASEAFARALLSGVWFGLELAAIPTLSGEMVERMNELTKGLACAQVKAKKPELQCRIQGARAMTPPECRFIALGAATSFPSFSRGPLAGKAAFSLEVLCDASGAAVQVLRQGDAVELSGPSGGSDEVGMAEAMMGGAGEENVTPPWSASLVKVLPLPPLKKGGATKQR